MKKTSLLAAMAAAVALSSQVMANNELDANFEALQTAQGANSNSSNSGDSDSSGLNGSGIDYDGSNNGTDTTDTNYGYGMDGTGVDNNRNPNNPEVDSSVGRDSPTLDPTGLDDNSSSDRTPSYRSLDSAPVDQAPIDRAPTDRAPTDLAPSDNAPSDLNRGVNDNNYPRSTDTPSPNLDPKSTEGSNPDSKAGQYYEQNQNNCSSSRMDTDENNFAQNERSCASDSSAVPANSEKCVPVVDGKNLISAKQSDCSTAKHSCASQNESGEVDAWVYVPKGVCDRILSGDFSDVPENVKAKLNLSSTSVAPSSLNRGTDEDDRLGMVDTFKSWFGI